MGGYDTEQSSSSTINLVVGGVLFATSEEAYSALHAGHGLSVTIASLLGTCAIAAWLLGGTAVVLGLARRIPRRMENLRRRAQVETVCVFGLACALAWGIAAPGTRRLTNVYVAIVIATGILCALAHWLNRASPPHLARGVCIAIAIALMAADQILNATTYPELHDLLFVVGVAFTVAALPEIRLSRHPALRLHTTGPAILGLLLWVLAGQINTGWARNTILDGSGVASMARLIHPIIDFDRDGYSPVLGGGDCDDFDSHRHPGAKETAGSGDANCNGTVLPESLTSADRGLQEVFGDPALPAESIDLFILLTIDCWRSDALDPQLSPRLWALSQRGLTVERMYSAASETVNSLPLLQQGDRSAPWVGDILQAAGVTASSVIGGNVVPKLGGIEHRQTATSAQQVTDLAVQRISKVGSTPHFLWIHYYDLHELYRFQHTEPPTSTSALPAAYQSATFAVDLAVGHLLDELDKQGKLQRTAILATADHGEGMGAHQVWSHARSGFESVMRVPGVFVAPSMPQRLWPQLGSHRDVPATILGAFGLSQAAEQAEVLGRSWLRLRQNSDRALHKFVVVQSARLASGARQDAPLAILVDDQYKLIAGIVDGFFSLYDLVNDPGELHNIAEEQPSRVETLWKQLGIVLDLQGQMVE